MNPDALKKMAAIEAVKNIESGMVLGLGTGSTVKFALYEISRLINEKILLDIIGIPSSKQTELLSMELGIKLTKFDGINEIDLNIDGADEIDPELNLIKGGGGALLKEKIIAQASKKNVIIADEGKLSEKLGSKWALPVEVIRFSYHPVKRYVESLGAKATLRMNQNGETFFSEQDNLIIDCNFGQIGDLSELDQKLNSKAGIVEHGLFLGIADEVIVGKSTGTESLKR